jgi:hypothetical protein
VRKRLLFVCIVTGAAGCVDVAATTGSDGKPAYTIDCDGESSGCFDKAAGLCPGGYFLVDRKNGTTEMPHTAGVVATPHTRIVVECK